MERDKKKKIIKNAVFKEQLKKGMEVETEHDDVVHGDKTKLRKIAMVHLREDPLYYTHLEEMEDKYEK